MGGDQGASRRARVVWRWAGTGRRPGQWPEPSFHRSATLQRPAALAATQHRCPTGPSSRPCTPPPRSHLMGPVSAWRSSISAQGSTLTSPVQ
jgi:hypothetical protein